MSITDSVKKISVGNVVDVELEEEFIDNGVVFNIEDDIASVIMLDGSIIEEIEVNRLRYKFKNINSYTKSNPDYS